jgi:hypothetical protein
MGGRFSSDFGSYRERRLRRAAALYRFEMALREEGAISDFVYDEDQDLLGDRGDIPQEPRGASERRSWWREFFGLE